MSSEHTQKSLLKFLYCNYLVMIVSNVSDWQPGYGPQTPFSRLPDGKYIYLCLGLPPMTLHQIPKTKSVLQPITLKT